MLHRFLIVYVCLSSFLVRAALPPPQDIPEIFRLSEGKDASMRGSVFVYGDQSLDNLIPVRVIGAVGKAGLHYVPKGLDLVTLVTLAGGTASTADVTSVSIKRQVGGKNEVLMANLEDLVSASDAEFPILQANDTVYIPQQTQVVSENLSKTIGLIVGLASIAVSVVVISDRRR